MPRTFPLVMREFFKIIAWAQRICGVVNPRSLLPIRNVKLEPRLSPSIFHTVSDKNLRRGKAGNEASHVMLNQKLCYMGG